MAITKTIQATVKNRTDTAANWTQKNPVLAEGEIIVVQTSAGETRLKIGDGVKTFTQLPYTDEQIYNNVVTSVNGQTGDVTLDIPDGGADWAQNNPDGDGYIKNRPGGYMSDPAYNEVFNGALGGEVLEAPCVFTSGDIVKVTIDGEEKDYTVVEEEVEGTTIYRVGTDPYINVFTGAVANGFAIATFTMDGVNAIISAAYGTYVGKTVVVKANVAMPVVIPAKFLPPKESDVIAIRLEKTGHDYARCSRSDYHKLHDAIDNGKEVILILSGGMDPANGWYRYSENKDDGMHFVRITDYGGCYMHTLVNTEINDNFAVFKVIESRTFVTTNDNPGSADEDGKMLVVKNGEWAKSDGKSITLKSSTEGSTKKFKLTIDDTGTLTASEITA